MWAAGAAGLTEVGGVAGGHAAGRTGLAGVAAVLVPVPTPQQPPAAAAAAVVVGVEAAGVAQVELGPGERKTWPQAPPFLLPPLA